MAVGVVLAGVRLPDRLGRPGPLERSLVTPRRPTAGPAYLAQALPSKAVPYLPIWHPVRPTGGQASKEPKKVSDRSSIIFTSGLLNNA